MIMYSSIKDIVNDYTLKINNGNIIYPIGFYSGEDILRGGYRRFDKYDSSSIIIGSEIISCNYLFSGSSNLNQSIIIPNNVIYCIGMFNNCRNFNQPITIPNNVTDCQNMFSNCYNFNQPITIPNNVTNCSYMFTYCNNFNQPITIPNNVTNCYRMFSSCRNFENSIYFKRINPSNLYVSSLIIGSNSSKKKNIFFNSALNSIFNVTNYNSIVGSSITWTPMTDGHGFYNTAFNVYCYNNYAP